MSSESDLTSGEGTRPEALRERTERALAHVDVQIANLTRDLAVLDTQLTETNETQHRVDTERRRARAELDACAVSRRTLTRENADAKEGIVATQERVNALQSDREKAEEQARVLETQAANIATTQATEVADIEAALEKAIAEKNSLEAQLPELTGSLETLRTQLTAVETETNTVFVRRQQIEREVAEGKDLEATIRAIALTESPGASGNATNISEADGRNLRTAATQVRATLETEYAEAVARFEELSTSAAQIQEQIQSTRTQVENVKDAIAAVTSAIAIVEPRRERRLRITTEAAEVNTRTLSRVRATIDATDSELKVITRYLASQVERQQTVQAELDRVEALHESANTRLEALKGESAQLATTLEEGEARLTALREERENAIVERERLGRVSRSLLKVDRAPAGTFEAFEYTRTPTSEGLQDVIDRLKVVTSTQVTGQTQEAVENTEALEGATALEKE